MTNAPPNSTVFGPDSLRAHLDYEPVPLQFGTSGRRGEVVHLTQLEVYINALAELEYLQSLSPSEGGIRRGDEFYFAYDLRPSSTRLVSALAGRGEIAQAIERALRDSGMLPVNLGPLPTPALTFHALQRGRGSVMITGSHIPFDRNGYKTNTARGELLKQDEAPINARVDQVRRRLYAQTYAGSLFNRHGMFKAGPQELSTERDEAREGYLRRYTDFFAPYGLQGRRFLVYQHSAVGRDLLLEILQRLGAEAIPAGRSDTFVPIDTENIDEEQLRAIQILANAAWADHGPFDAVVSTDGDSDRPLVLGVEIAEPQAPEEARCRVRFFSGDLVGMIVAEYLGADAVVVPISCNDAVDRGSLKELVEPKTKIGSPYVIAGMEKARQKGRRAICGWEANGGFLLGSDLNRNGQLLSALPTRDAMLPILGLLYSAAGRNLSLSSLCDRLPQRFSRAALLRRFPRPTSQRIVQRFSPGDARVKEVRFERDGVVLLDSELGEISAAEALTQALQAIGASLGRFFTPSLGFGRVARLDYTDGVRIYFNNGEVAHFRPSGNADELRMYAVADTQARADAIAGLGIAEPEGILRRLEHACAANSGRADA